MILLSLMPPDVTQEIIPHVSSVCRLMWNFSSELSDPQLCRFMTVQGSEDKVSLLLGL